MLRVVGLCVIAASTLACATSSPSPSPLSSSLSSLGDQPGQRPVSLSGPARLDIPEVPTPRNAAEAGVLIAEVSDRLRREDRPGAIARITAMLHSDFLTDHGRASLYWLLAETSNGVDDVRRKDALGGYLVASSTLPPDPELLSRARQARGALLALKIQQQALGLSPKEAILVPTHTDADIVVASLSCGNEGDGRYVERRLPGSFRGDALEPRRLLCSENGDELTLWFRVEE